MTFKKTLIITHGRKGYLRTQKKHFSRPYLIGGREFACIDGLAAAYITYRAHPVKGTKVFPTNYGEDFPWVHVDADTDVVIVDFSYSREVLLEVKSKVKSLLVLDHHKTSKEELEGLDFCIFDMTKSGTVLAWEYYNPGKPLPELFKYINDYDLWTKKYHDTNVVIEGISHIPRHLTFRWWDIALTKSFSNILSTGRLFYNDELRRVEDLVVNKRYRLVELNGHNVAVVNHDGPVNELLQGLYNVEGVDYALSYFITKSGSMLLQFRSNGVVDVGEIAKSLDPSGGGHAAASGVTLTAPASFEFLKMLYGC